MAAPKSGRLFLKSHGDCFIHATVYFVKYWNFSLTQEGLGIVRVTIVHPNERVILACISPKPLPFESVQQGIDRRKYLEIDPCFAAELNISQDTEVILEPVRSIEKCLRLKLAPKNPADYDMLVNNIEKIHFELAERIRVVSCQHFFTFPVWVNQDVVPVKIVSSEPSANWVLIVSDETMVELSSGQSNSKSSSSTADATTVTTTTTTLPSVTTPDPSEEDSPFHSMYNNSVISSLPEKARSRSSASAVSAESSVDTDSGSNWGIGHLLRRARQFLELSTADYVNPRGSAEDDEREVIQREPIPEQDERYEEYPFHSQEGETINNKDRMHEELLHQQLGSKLCMRGDSSTPDPVIPSPKKNKEANAVKPSHKRTATWHSETEFTSPRKAMPKLRSGKSKLQQFISTPTMKANLRVQPHPIKGIKSATQRDSKSWYHERIFNVFVHPSTLPEVYHYMQKKSPRGSFLVELYPILQPNGRDPKRAESVPDSSSIDSSGGQVGKNSSQDNSGLPSSLVVKLCFATEILVSQDGFSTHISEGREEKAFSLEENVLKVPVQIGHVVMSDLVRQQLAIKECSRVIISHVLDSWKMSIADNIKIVIQPIGNFKKDNFKHLLTGFHDWIKVVSDVSEYGVVLVNKQVILLEVSAGDWVKCRLNVASGKLVHNQDVRVSYCILTPREYTRKQVSLVVDSVFNRNPSSFRHHSQSSTGSPRQQVPQGEEDFVMPDISSLSLPEIQISPEDFGAFKDLVSEGFTCLHTAFMGPKRCSTLLVCGMSGTAGAGCGKTTLVRLMAKRAMSHPYFAFMCEIECTYLRGMSTVRTKKHLSDAFSEAIHKQPSVLVLENLDLAMPLVTDAQEQVQEEGINSDNKTQLLKELLYRLRCKGAQVLVIATARNKQHLNMDLLSSQGRYSFDRVLEIQPPTMIDRKDMLGAILHSKKLSLNDKDLRVIASKTEGFQAGDLVTLVDRAVSLSELRVLCPSHLITGFDSPQGRRCRRISVDSGSDLESSLELSSSPQKSFSTLPSSNILQKGHNFLESPLVDSGISSPATMAAASEIKKKISVVSASTLTPSTPRSFEIGGAPHMFKTGSLSQMYLTLYDFLTALEGYVPVSLRGLPLHSSETIDFSHVGGMESNKKILIETLLWPSKYPNLFSQCPIKQRCGVMLYGAPGTGKTLLAGAVAKEFGLNFVSIKGPELLSKYIGASEKAVRDIFTRAQSARPCILFFDEFDSLAPRRGHDNTGVTDRVVNQLLTQLDGVESLEGVYILAASSRPDLIDPALLRPGRIDLKVFCSIPDENERYEILKTLGRDLRKSIDVNFKELAKSCHTEHFTGADLKALLYNAQLQAAHDALDRKQKNLDSTSQVSLSATPISSPESSVKSLKNANPLVFSFSSKSGVIRHTEIPKEIEQKVASLQEKVVRRRKYTLTPPHRNSLEENRSLSLKLGSQRVMLTQNLLLNALQELRPSVSEKERLKYKKIYERFTGKTEKMTIQDMEQIITLA